MLAAVLEKLGEFTLQEVPSPKAEPGSVLLKVMACAICGTDLRMFRHGHRSLRLPQVIGHEVAGIVVEAPGVNGVKPGQRVALAPRIPCGECYFCRRGSFNLCPTGRSFGFVLSGGFAEYMLIPPEGVRAGLLIPFDDNLSYEVASLAEPLSCVVRAQEQAEVSEGDLVAIIGGGPIGWMHGYLARWHDARPILLEHNPQRVVVSAGSPFEAVVDNRRVDVPLVIQDLTEGRGADVVVVACSSADAQVESLSLVRRGGKVNFFGGLPPDHPPVAVDTNVIHYSEISIFGSHGSTAADVRSAVETLQSHEAEMKRLVTHVFPLKEISQAFAMAESRQALKVVVKPV